MWLKNTEKKLKLFKYSAYHAIFMLFVLPTSVLNLEIHRAFLNFDDMLTCESN